MNLYKLIFSHHSPKDSEVGMKGLILAENDEQVYEWLKSVDEINGDGVYLSWQDKEDDGEEFEIYNKNYDVVGKESFKEKIIRLKGEINDEDYDFSDAYYGITLYGWELLKENVDPSKYSELIELKIAYQIHHN